MWGNARVGTAALVRPVKRSETRISTTASPETHQAGKHNAVANSLLHFSPFICYKQSTESSSVASRAKLSATLVARPASNDSRGRESLQLSRPRDFIRKSNTVSEGYLQSKDLQKDLFSIFCLPTRAVAKNACAETGVYPTGRPYCCAYSSARPRILTQSLVIPSGFIVRNLLSLAALPHSLPERFSRCGNHLEILWEATIDGIYTATYACKVSRTVGFA
jgi:hypothetical protein